MKMTPIKAYQNATKGLQQVGYDIAKAASTSVVKGGPAPIQAAKLMAELPVAPVRNITSTPGLPQKKK